MDPTGEPVDDLAQEIAELSEGIQKLLGGRLTERALVTLIYDAMAPTSGASRKSKRC